MDSVVAWVMLMVVVVCVVVAIANKAKPREQKKYSSVNTYNCINWK